MTEIEHSQAKRDFGIYTQARCFILVLRPFPKTRKRFYVIKNDVFKINDNTEFCLKYLLEIISF